MTGITHKQAQRYLRAAADGLLRENQRALLDAHLRECASCRAEADQLNALESRLKKNFQERWDVQDGPSKNVMTIISSRSRRIIMSNRINTGLKTVAGIATLLLLAVAFSFIVRKVQTPLAGTATDTPLPLQSPSIGTDKFNGEWLAFTEGEYNFPEDQKVDVYMIHPDGSGLVNVTNFPAYYHSLQWSPDGKNLVFLREHDGVIDFMRISQYDFGPEVIIRPITNSEHHGFSWSPNGDKIVFADSSNGNYDIYTMYADGRNDPQLAQLTNDPGQDVGFAWSPDGSQIAYERLDGNNLSIFTMNKDGSNQREVAHGAGKVKLHWSNDGATLYTSASTESDWLSCDTCVARPGIYRIDLEEQSVHQVHYEQDASKVDGWYLYDTPQNMLYIMRIKHSAFLNLQGTWLQADNNSVRDLGDMNPHQSCKTTSGSILGEHISPNKRFSIITSYCAGGFDLYLADREATTPEQKLVHLLKLPLGTYGQGGDGAYLPINWSPDGRWLIYDNGNKSIYLLNIERAMRDPSTEPSFLFHSENNTFFAWQPARAEKAVEQKPTPSPSASALTVQEAETLAGFDILEPSYIPEGYAFQDGSYDPQTQTIILKYVSSTEYYGGAGEILLYQQSGSFLEESNNLPTHATPVAVGNVTGEFTHGAWVYDSPETKTPRWEDSDTVTSLVWKKDGITFAIDFLGGEGIPPVSMNELVAIAESME